MQADTDRQGILGGRLELVGCVELSPELKGLKRRKGALGVAASRRGAVPAELLEPARHAIRVVLEDDEVRRHRRHGFKRDWRALEELGLRGKSDGMVAPRSRAKMKDPGGTRWEDPAIRAEQAPDQFSHAVRLTVVKTSSA